MGGGIWHSMVAKWRGWMSPSGAADPVEQAWLDFQESWDWAMEPNSRDVFKAGYEAARKLAESAGAAPPIKA